MKDASAIAPTRLLIAVGVFWALLTAAIWSASPALTRFSVIRTINPEDLVAFRYAIGGVILLPILIRQAASIPAAGWREGWVLALFQGAPPALLVGMGVRLAPASHMAALSLGLMPLFASMLSFLFLHERLSASRGIGVALISVGALVIVGVSASGASADFWIGDLMFICASLMGSAYTVRMRRCGLSAIQGAALISVYSMIVYLPLYFWFWFASSRLTETPPREVLLQAGFQGILMGVVTLFSLSRAVVILGAARTAAFLSLVPVLGTVFGIAVLHEIPSAAETAAVVVISLGVLLAAGALQRSYLGTNRSLAG